MTNPEDRWQRTMWTVVLVQFIVGIARTSAFPFMALYFIQLGVTNTSAVALWTGASVSAGFFVAVFSAPVWGWLADRTGRKLMMVRATLGLAVCAALFGITTAPWQVLGLRFVMGAVTGFGASATALVATRVPEGRLGFALGWVATGDTVGSLVGPLVGGLLADHLHGYRPVFFVTGALAGLAALVAALFIEERRAPQGVHERPRAPFWKSLVEMFHHPNLAPLLVVIMMTQVTVLGIGPLVPLFITSLVDPSWLATAAGIAAATTGFADVIASPWLGKRSDKVGYRRILLISLIGAAIFTIPQGFVHNYGTFIGLRFGVGLFLGGILPTTNAWIGRLIPPEQRGAVYGMTGSAAFLGMAIGPMLAGVLAAHFGFIAVFTVMGGAMLLNFAWLAKTSAGSGDRAFGLAAARSTP